MSRDLFDVYRKGRLIGDALRRYRGLFAIGTVAIIVVDVLDVILPLFVKGIIDAIEAKDLAQIKWYCAFYVGIAVIQAIGRIFWRVGFYQLGTSTACDLRRQIQQHLFKLPLANFSKKKTGETLTLAQSDTEAVRTLVEHGMVTFFDAFIYVVGIPIVLFWLSPTLAAVSLLALPLIPYFVARFEKSLKTAARIQQEALAALTRSIFESFASIRLIKSFAREDDFAHRFAVRSSRLVEASVSLSRKEAFFAPRLELVISVSLALLLFFGSNWIMAGALSIGTFVAFERYLHRLLWPTQAIGVWLSYLQRAAASSERIEQFLSEAPEQLAGEPTKPDFNSPVALKVSRLSFTYPGEKEPLLKDLEIMLRRGERVAIVGPSGCGKTTLLQLLLGVQHPESGTIELFGADYSGLSVAALSQSIASVEQNPFLFSDTIHHNIAPRAGAATVLSAAEGAAIAEEIQSLPQGMATLIGERGVTLSGGQRQRVAIARSLARMTPVLIWDNALSAVDLATEARIVQTISKLPGDAAALIVTHRLSTTRLMDRVLVLNNGTIVQQGSHQELLQNRNGWYAEFCRKQELMSELEIEEQRND